MNGDSKVAFSFSRHNIWTMISAYMIYGLSCCTTSKCAFSFFANQIIWNKKWPSERLHLVSYFSDNHRKWPCIASSRKFYSEQYHQWKRKYHPYRKPSKLEGHWSSYQWRRPYCCGSTTAVRRHNSTKTSAFDIRNKWKKFRQWYRGFEIQR